MDQVNLIIAQDDVIYYVNVMTQAQKVQGLRGSRKFTKDMMKCEIRPRTWKK